MFHSCRSLFVTVAERSDTACEEEAAPLENRNAHFGQKLHHGSDECHLRHERRKQAVRQGAQS